MTHSPDPSPMTADPSVFEPQVLYRNGKFKRIFDVIFSATAVAVLLPLMLMVALAIFLVDGRSPIFRHQRVGQNGRTFACLKFRTMVVNAEEALETLLRECPVSAREWETSRKLRNDPRILPVIGGVLRSASLDELPQFFNVLLGDMSIIGPRPVIEDELVKYGEFRSLYTSVRPGLTGPWQAGNRSNDTYENRVRLDVEYIRSPTVRKDVSIILATAKIFLRGRDPNAF